MKLTTQPYKLRRFLVVERSKDLDRVRIKRESSDRYCLSYFYHSKRVRKWTEHATVELTIDIDALVKRMGGQAIRNKTGKSREIDGLVSCKVVYRKVVDEVIVKNPIPEGCSEVP